MSSIFKKLDNRTIKGFANKKYKVPIYLQFVPGSVVDVVYSDQNLKHEGPSTLNTIIAIPHISNKVFERKSTAMVGEHRRYYPLLRGIVDVPSKGDPVLLCTIGKVNYYLGPLNTMDNNPTWNDDPNFQEEISLGPDDEVARSSAEMAGENPNFNKGQKWTRLHKKWKTSPIHPGFDLSNALNETTGDMILEGRHGNSIRIGSRSNNPYMFLSNGRDASIATEGLTDGSLISITRRGPLSLHFGGQPAQVKGVDEQEVFPTFQVASDTIPKDKKFRPMTKLVGIINNDINHIDNYSGDQMLFHSDRITINSKFDDIYLSSIQDIHMGTGRHLTISTNEDLIIESGRTFLGNPFFEQVNNPDPPDRLFKGLEVDDASRRMQPMILGQELYIFLKEFADIVSKLHTGNLFFPVPLTYQEQRGAPQTDVGDKMAEVIGRLDKLMSNKHFIEPNE